MLWATVRELAAEARTRMPEEIWLTAEVNAAVQEEPRFLGLSGDAAASTSACRCCRP